MSTSAISKDVASQQVGQLHVGAAKVDMPIGSALPTNTKPRSRSIVRAILVDNGLTKAV
ncbi:MAG: hypothetical protein R2932_58730 [Caldilineaceae bacterium]